MQVKFKTYNKALPPRPIRVEVPGWSGNPQKMVDGSEPEPWHCLPFVEGATYGLELLYPYETECHVINDGDSIRFEWDYSKEPGGELTGGEFVTFFPKPASKFYLFNTSLDIQAPAGHVVATHPHPRFFTDVTGTAPVALTGHVQTEWWPKKFFVVFKSPPPGQRHIFRHNEPYAALRILPQRERYDLAEMTDAEAAERRELEQDVLSASQEIATNVWRNPFGYAFNNHYKILAGIFSREGAQGVKREIRDAARTTREQLPANKSIAQYMEMGAEHFKQRRLMEAKRLYVHVLSSDPQNAEAVSRLGIIAACEGMPLLALKLMTQAAAISPANASYHTDLGELYRRMGRFAEAEASLRQSLRLDQNNPQVWSNLGLVLLEMGRNAEAAEACRIALSLNPTGPLPYARMGETLLRNGELESARSYFQKALSIDPKCEEAQRGMINLSRFQ